MKELTLELDDTIGNGRIISTIEDINYESEFKDYMKSIDGILEIKILSENKVYIKYNLNLINMERIKLEILFYFSLLNIPSILSFDKHEKSNSEYKIVIKDLCCEYCLKGMIEDLLQIDGIKCAYSDFDYDSKTDIYIYI